MWWVLGLLGLVVAVLGVVLARRGSGGLGGNPDAARPPESFRIPGAGGGNSGLGAA
jgi:hypothetical protein